MISKCRHTIMILKRSYIDTVITMVSKRSHKDDDHEDLEDTQSHDDYDDLEDTQSHDDLDDLEDTLRRLR